MDFSAAVFSLSSSSRAVTRLRASVKDSGHKETNRPWLVTSVPGVWGTLGDALLAAGRELSCSHGNTATGVEKTSDWSDAWRWGAFLFWCWGDEAEPTSENWSRCRGEENRKGDVAFQQGVENSVASADLLLFCSSASNLRAGKKREEERENQMCHH
ncbi:hypothetical protein EYF80_044325 [Liparis tanakae]|uniref:Uncharacterized protein n=1 Tax=Liparis tanakae TaxID=230148 RepID=A0A4Z2FW50_9TELE|nr:hypothetical protein EYF80_044325 [Liparis tanakae]